MLGRQVISIIASCLLLMGATFPTHAKKLETERSPQQLEQLKTYHDSGKYLLEIQEKTADAKEYLDRQLLYPRKTQLAIVLDIDETALSNYGSLERLHFTQNMQALTAAYLLAEAQPIAPVLALYQHALANNVAVFFVSSRPNTPEILALTVKNLKTAGFEQWQELILMPMEKANLSIADFKTTSRRHITAQGFDILLNVGDQNSDLIGGYAEVKVKIPNPFYTLT